MVHVHEIEQQVRPAKTEKNQRTSVPLLQQELSVLLALPLRFQHMSGVYAPKSVGDDLQPYYLAMPGLW